MENTTSGNYWPLLIVLLLVLLTAFFVAAEFSLVAVRRSRVQQLAEKGSTSAKLLKSAFGRLDTFIATTQLGITILSLVLGSFGEPYVTGLIKPFFLRMFGSIGETNASYVAFAISLILITFVTVLFGELIPKGYALQRTEQVALLTIVPLNIFRRLTTPFVWLFSKSGNFFLRLLGLNEAHSHSMVGSAEELKLIVEASSKDGVLNESEGEIISQILDLEETAVRAIMVPRVDMVAIDGKSTLQEFWNLAKENRYSRVPVFLETVDKIIGIAYIKDLLEYSGSTFESKTVQSICHPAYFVPETMGARDLLAEMRRRKTHIAIVVDEFKGTAGLVTMEDIVEEIIGEIYDESDEVEEIELIFQTSPGSFSISASAPLAEVSDALDIKLPEGEYDTLSGYLMDQFGHIPEVGENIIVSPYVFSVETADPRGIERVRVERIEAYAQIAGSDPENIDEV